MSSGERVIRLHHRLEERSLLYLLEPLIKMKRTGELILVSIDSPGGDWGPAKRLYDEIASTEGPILGIVEGSATSTAALILQACKRRIIRPTGKIGLHSLIFDFSAKITALVDQDGQLLPLAEEQIRENLLHYWQKQREMETIFAHRCKLPLNKIRELLRGEDQIFSATEALELGLVDDIID